MVLKDVKGVDASVRTSLYTRSTSGMISQSLRVFGGMFCPLDKKNSIDSIDYIMDHNACSNTNICNKHLGGIWSKQLT